MSADDTHRTDGTFLTERQLEVLERRQAGKTQQEVANEIDTTAANVSAIERSGRENVEKARRTLELVRTVHAPVQFTVPAETTFADLVDMVYDRSDEAGIKVEYCRPELHSHLYTKLQSHTEQNQVTTTVTIGLSEQGEVNVYTDRP